MSRVVHFEIAVDDAARARAFYENVLGWKINKWDGPRRLTGWSPRAPTIRWVSTGRSHLACPAFLASSTRLVWLR